MSQDPTTAASLTHSIMRAIGQLEGEVTATREGTAQAVAALNRRIDDTRREIFMHIRRLDQKRGGNGSRKLQVAGLIVMGFLSALGHVKAETVQGILIRMLLTP